MPKDFGEKVVLDYINSLLEAPPAPVNEPRAVVDKMLDIARSRRKGVK